MDEDEQIKEAVEPVSGESDNDGSGSEQEDEEEEQVEWMVETRAKRSNAGNRMSAVMQNEDEEDEVSMLFAEGADEDNEFEGSSEEQDEDEDDDSSSDDDDQGPTAAEGDLEGEEELKKQERQAKRVEKRKAAHAMLKIPAMRKRVKIVESSTERQSSATPVEKPKKKSERVSWLNMENAPVRTSSRALSIRNKEKTLASMQEGEKRRVSALKSIEASKRRKEERRATLPRTQAEMLAEAARVEEINSKSLNKWEEMEAERVKKQKDRLEALQNRRLEGPVIRWYSGPAEWEYNKLIRVGKISGTTSDENNDHNETVATPKIVVQEEAVDEGGNETQTADATGAQSSNEQDQDKDKVENELDGVQLDASLPDASIAEGGGTADTGIDTGAEGAESNQPASHELEVEATPPTTDPEATHQEHQEGLQSHTLAEEVQPNEETDTKDTVEEPTQRRGSAAKGSDNHDEDTVTYPPFERSTRNLVQLINFDDRATSNPAVLRRILLKLSPHMPLQPSHSKRGYIDPPSGIYRQYGGPKRADPPVCAISSSPAQYQDPDTLLPYSGVESFKEIRKAIRGGARWSEFLGAWIGAETDGNGVGGKPAAGVPDGFMNAAPPGDAVPNVKTESAG